MLSSSGSTDKDVVMAEAQTTTPNAEKQFEQLISIGLFTNRMLLKMMVHA